jgi:hypothetical protein
MWELRAESEWERRWRASWSKCRTTVSSSLGKRLCLLNDCGVRWKEEVCSIADGADRGPWCNSTPGRRHATNWGLRGGTRTVLLR